MAEKGDHGIGVGDGARRMTYAELAAVRGISPASAKRLTQRHRWGRQIGNDGVVRVTVPLSALVNPAKTDADTDSLSPAPEMTATPIAVTGDIAGDVLDDVSGDVTPATNALIRAIEALREQLAKADQREEAERRRAEHAEHRLEVERQVVDDSRKRIDELYIALADAVAAERIAAGEASALRAIVTERRAPPWWRRWFR